MELDGIDLMMLASTVLFSHVICVFISLYVAPVALAIVYMPGLYPTAYRATFPAFLCGWL